MIIRADGDKAFFGWPDIPQVEAEVTAWYERPTAVTGDIAGCLALERARHKERRPQRVTNEDQSRVETIKSGDQTIEIARIAITDVGRALETPRSVEGAAAMGRRTSRPR